MGLGGQHSHSSFLSQSSGMLNPQQPMSTLSSTLDSPSGLGRMDSSSGLPPSMESMRTSSPRFSAASSPSGLGASSSFGSPRFESGHFDTRFDAGSSASAGPSTLRSTTNASSRFDADPSSQFDANTTSQFDAPSQFDSNYDSPQYGTATSASPTGFGSSSSTPPGFGATGSVRRSSSSDRNRDEVK
ncbi:hypothetical protein BDV93DRAFT_305299 [Ceratobasidium sp. AG-I]|nr:hypothetical protein BDV93DRAFT_305299 [Ceratobasidium sp. AG-I]